MNDKKDVLWRRQQSCSSAVAQAYYALMGLHHELLIYKLCRSCIGTNSGRSTDRRWYFTHSNSKWFSCWEHTDSSVQLSRSP